MPWVLLAVLVPLLVAAVCVGLWNHPRHQRSVSLGGAILSLGVAAGLLTEVVTHGPRTIQFSGWIEPFAISFMADVLGALLVTVCAVVGLATVLTERHETSIPSPGTAPFLHMLLAGVAGAFLTADLFNLYVWFEVLLIASFVLLVVEGGRKRLQGALVYVLLNLLGSLLFLSAVGLVYGLTRSLHMAVVAERMMTVAQTSPELAHATLGLFLLAFGLKAGVFPLFFWLPVSYPALPGSLGGLFAGLLTKVGVYALLRVCTLVVPPDTPGVFPLLLGTAGLTMVIGVLAAVSRGEIRSILSFHILSQIGYMIVGIGLVGATEPALRHLAVAATVFYIVHHILVKANLFLVGGAVRAALGDSVLSRTGGLVRSHPVLAGLFLIPALSLAGIPPLSGFWAKLVILRAGIEAREYVVVACALGAGLFTLLSMVKIWNEAFWKPRPGSAGPPPRPIGAGRLLPIAGLAAVTVGIGLHPDPLLRLAERSADELLGARPEAVVSATTAIDDTEPRDEAGTDHASGSAVPASSNRVPVPAGIRSWTTEDAR